MSSRGWRRKIRVGQPAHLVWTRTRAAPGSRADCARTPERGRSSARRSLSRVPGDRAGSATPVSSNASTRSFLNWACAGVSGVTACTRANSASFWKTSTWNVERLRMASSAASRTLLSGWTLFRIAIGPSMFSRAIAIRSHSSSTIAGVASLERQCGERFEGRRARRPTSAGTPPTSVMASRIGQRDPLRCSPGITHLLPYTSACV